jgi:ribosome-binding factor A
MGKGKRERERPASQSFRGERLQELIRQEVNFLLRHEIRDRRLEGVEATMVELAGECARVWFTADNDDEASLALERAAGWIRSQLAESLGLKRTPELRFRHDPATRAFGNTEKD